MLIPTVSARMKQRNDLTRSGIERYEVWTLVSIAIWASECEIAWRIILYVLRSLDVFNVESYEHRE
ncbi:MAG: hypothetical protein ABI557_12095 [Aureliella sp.]